MDEAAKDDIEDSVFAGFSNLTLCDKETGETLYLNRDAETGEVAPAVYASGILLKKKSGFRIPLEFLKREISSEECKTDNTLTQNVKVCSSFEETTKEPTRFEEVVFAEAPHRNLPAIFCRKRKPSGETDLKSSAVNALAECKMPRFLEGREGLLWAIQLFLVALSLFSPGFFFPIIFLIKLMCHYRQHDENFELDSMHHHGEHPACFFIRQVCRVCREKRNAERMFQLHSNFSGRGHSKIKLENNNNNCPNNENCTICA